MSSKKTPIGELIAWVSKEKTFSSHQRHILKEKLESMLLVERSAIEAAYDQGDTDRMNHERGKESKFVSKKQYYINTYDTYPTQKDNG